MRFIPRFKNTNNKLVRSRAFSRTLNGNSSVENRTSFAWTASPTTHHWTMRLVMVMCKLRFPRTHSSELLRVLTTILFRPKSWYCSKSLSRWSSRTWITQVMTILTRAVYWCKNSSIFTYSTATCAIIQMSIAVKTAKVTKIKRAAVTRRIVLGSARSARTSNKTSLTTYQRWIKLTTRWLSISRRA